MTVRPCPNCNGTSQYRSAETVSAGGRYAPNFLPGLGAFFRAARFEMIICADSGLTRFFADAQARIEAAASDLWTGV